MGSIQGLNNTGLSSWHDTAHQEPLSRIQQFGGVPEADGDLDTTKPKGKTPKAKAKSKAKAKAKGKSRSSKPSPKAKAKAKAKAFAKSKAKKEKVEESEVLVTPKRAPPKGDAQEGGSRSKQSKKRTSEGGTTSKKDAKEAPTKTRASKGNAASFARRNPPANERAKAEWEAIRSAYRRELMYLRPQTKHEDRVRNKDL